MTASAPDGERGPFIETPLEALQETLEERVVVEGREFKIARPRQADTLLDHPAVRARFSDGEYLPYWVDLWPSARMLSKIILRESWPAAARALEIGCGLGLPGVAALSAGLHVTFTDCDRSALHFAGRNARANGFHKFELLPLDWNHPPTGLQFPIVFGSDLIYESRNVAPLVDLIDKLLAPNGTCLVTDQDRVPAEALRQALEAHGLRFSTKVVHAGEPGGRRSRGTLYRITRG
jgi:predicted nicotinamide N-methyase